MQLFPKNKRLFKVRRPRGSHVHSKSGSIKDIVQDSVMDMSSGNGRPMGASVARLVILVSGARSRSWS